MAFGPRNPLLSLLRWLFRHIKRSLAGSADTIARKSQTIKAKVKCIMSPALTRAQETSKDDDDDHTQRQWIDSKNEGGENKEAAVREGEAHSICTTTKRSTELLSLLASVDHFGWTPNACIVYQVIPEARRPQLLRVARMSDWGLKKEIATACTRKRARLWPMVYPVLQRS